MESESETERGSGTRDSAAGLTGTAARELREVLGDRLVTSRASREQHGRDESPLPEVLPDAVAFPRTTEEVSAVVRTCSAHGIAVVPFGAGTSLEGHVLPVAGGVSLDLTRMDRIVEVNVDDLDVTAEAGVTRSVLNERLRRDGLFFPVDPGADATLGGMAATGASGTMTVRYGSMRDNVLGLKVVLADGRVVRTAHRARKSSAGYDLTRLFVGSEGTLGVITEVTLRLVGLPEATGGAMTHFRDTQSAVRAVIEVLQLGIPVARIEFLDESSMRALNAHSRMDYAVAPTLLLEFHGSPDGVAEQVGSVAAVAGEHGALDYRSALDGIERARLWRARHDHFYASLALRPGAKAITTDVCVPISRLADCILATKEDIDETDLVTTIVGHVGDGNFHVMMMVDPQDVGEMQAAEDLNRRLVQRALDMDGTCTGEHGIGLRKMSSLELELPDGVDVMKSIKRALDPHNVMNPGKVFQHAPNG